ncbi:hypothetical protein [Streptomyces sp.]|uniref:hypothetical protein n=1 Tax=Streptomyces sp. TaxID=1931 RepID=UPI002F92C09B
MAAIYGFRLSKQPPFEGVHPAPGWRVRFDGKRTTWLARAATRDGRYLILTASFFGAVHYTILDFVENVRGAMDIVGYGLGIDTTSGPDPAIDKAIDMLHGGRGGGWEVSARNRVAVNITGLRPRDAQAWETP